MLELYELECLGQRRIEALRRERAVGHLARELRGRTPAGRAARRRVALALLTLAVWLAPSLGESVTAERRALAPVRA
ncbi:MAG TPA: hypothetical protein VFW96_24010 [Thermomicrobiales bacterium]|nr:hypothetical protein [Thermomicrobiales bacterium]